MKALEWLSENKETVVYALKVVGIGGGMIIAALQGTRVYEEGAEAKLKATVAQEEKYGAFDSFRDYIIDVESRRAGCDAALEMYARNRRQRTEDDWGDVMKRCHR